VANKSKITTILGTRPELIRLSCILEKFDIVFDHRIIHSGQNSDPQLLKVFITELGIREPDRYLEIPKGTLGSFCSRLFLDIEEEFDLNPPDAVVILGDTNSALAGIIAKRRGIPVYHLEAGNRSFDANVPEEINRKIVDHFADYNLAYTQNARENLIREGLHPQTITVIGSPLREVLDKYSSEINESVILDKLKLVSGDYFLVSAHRQENVDQPNRILELFDSLNWIASEFNRPIVVSTHPRTAEKIRMSGVNLSTSIQLHQPFGFLDYIKLQQNALVVLSDSGSVPEESAILGFNAITVRDSMERQEALAAGSIIMAGVSQKGISEALNIIASTPRSQSIPLDYQVKDTSTRVVNFIASTLHSHNFRNAIRKSE
jgi:UDP-N-acetylglucosamine 2-epimerase (non-hydrolysing)